MQKVISIGFNFAKDDIKIKDHKDHIVEAVESVSRHLFHKFEVKVLDLYFDEKMNSCEINLTAEKEEADKYEWPRRLSGISKYLLKKWPDVYEQLRIGTRLFYYWYYVG